MDYSVVFSSNKIFHEKSSWIRSWFKQFCKCFFLRPSLYYLDVQKSSQCVLPMPLLRILIRYVFKSWYFMKLIISTASCKVKQTCVKLWVANIVTTSVVLLFRGLCEGASSFMTIAFLLLCKRQYSEKGNWHFSIIRRTALTSWTVLWEQLTFALISS